MPRHDHFAISAGNELTLEAAKEVLNLGGNAFDAAIAAHFTMYISEPCMASLGAGGFAMCYTKENGPELLDFFTQTPRKKPSLSKLDFNPILVDFGNEQEEFHIGAASIATPGSVAGMFALNKRLGTLPMNELIDLVISLTQSGVPVDKFQALDFKLLEPIFSSSPYAKEYFFKENCVLEEGDNLVLPDFIDFLDFLKMEGSRGVYEGEISQKVDEYSIEHGGFIRRQDFENYSVRWHKPLNIQRGGHSIVTAPSPSLGGIIMKMLFHFISEKEMSCAESVVQILLNCKTIEDFKNYHNVLFKDDGFIQGYNISSKGTSHFNIVDSEDNAISLTCSLGEGSGYFVPGTLMQMNNMLGESFLLPGGFHSWVEDQRLNSMMTPTMVLNQHGSLVYAGGSGGAGRIPFMIAQVIDNILTKSKSIEEATLASRVFFYGGKLQLEKDYADPIPQEMELNIWEEPSLFFGGVNSIIKNNDACQAFADPRRFGFSFQK